MSPKFSSVSRNCLTLVSIPITARVVGKASSPGLASSATFGHTVAALLTDYAHGHLRQRRTNNTTTTRSAVFEIFRILGFPIDSHVKLSKCHEIFKTWSIAKKSNNLYLIHYGRQCPHKVWLTSMKTVGGVTF